jgi:hypothetical protein
MISWIHDVPITSIQIHDIDGVQHYLDQSQLRSVQKVVPKWTDLGSEIDPTLSSLCVPTHKHGPQYHEIGPFWGQSQELVLPTCTCSTRVWMDVPRHHRIEV